MLLRNFMSTFSNSVQKRLFFAAGVSSCAINTAVLISAKRPNNKTPLKILNPFLNTSIKEFLDADSINELNKFFRPVDDFQNSYIFVKDEWIAKNIVEQILGNTNTEKKIVVEANPGVGLITVNLLNCGVKHIHIFENQALQKLRHHQILKKCLMAVTENRVVFQNLFVENYVFHWLKLGQVRETSVKFIGTFTNDLLLKSLAISFIHGFLVDEKFEMYLVLSTKLYQNSKVYCSKRLKYLNFCVLNLFFYFEELASYPRSGFLPPSNNDNEIMYLVKITINSNFLKNFENIELREFFVFITLLGGKKKFIIQTLEKWLPNCGLYLISKGVSVTNTIQDFSPRESFILFKIFQKCKGYDDFRNFALKLL